MSQETFKQNFINLFKSDKFPGSQPESLEKAKKLPENYATTFKVDGERSLLYIDNAGSCYSISRNMEITNIFSKCVKYKNTVIDGEIVENTTSVKYYGFDIICLKGIDIRENKIYLLNKRCEDMKTILENITSKFCEFTAKKYWPANRKNIEMLLKKYENDMEIGKVDGLIFTPINKPYPAKKNRNVSLKWKPPHLNTIDFRIKKLKTGQNEYETWDLYLKNKNGEFALEPNSLRNFNATRIGTIPNEYKDDSIVECRFHVDLCMFVPIRTRTDKTVPNFITTARNVWKSIKNPVDLSIFGN